MADNREGEDDPRIRQRLDEVLLSIMCPIAGCWPLHGAESVLYYDQEADAYVLQTWPVGIEEPEEHEGNGSGSVGEPGRPGGMLQQLLAPSA